MIKEYLNRVSTDLSRYNQTLTKTSMLIDKPWALIDDNNEIQKLIFKKNHDLILSKNGKAEIGKWEYLPEAKSLLIDRITDKILCNVIFIEKGVIILKLDGIANEFFALANENIIPNLDIIEYIEYIVESNFKPSEKRVYLLEGDKKIEIHSNRHIHFLDHHGVKVTFDNKDVSDGFYKFKETSLTLLVKNSKIHSTLFENNFVLDDKSKITVYQRLNDCISINDYVSINGQIANNDCYFLSSNKKVFTENGLIKKILVRFSIFNFPIGDFREVKF